MRRRTRRRRTWKGNEKENEAKKKGNEKENETKKKGNEKENEAKKKGNEKENEAKKKGNEKENEAKKKCKSWTDLPGGRHSPCAAGRSSSEGRTKGTQQEQEWNVKLRLPRDRKMRFNHPDRVDVNCDEDGLDNSKVTAAAARQSRRQSRRQGRRQRPSRRRRQRKWWMQRQERRQRQRRTQRQERRQRQQWQRQ